MKANVEFRRAGNEMLPLLVLALTSMALVGGMSYAVQAPDTVTSIARTVRVVFPVLGGGILAIVLLFLAQGRPRDVVASVEGGELFLEEGGRRRRIAPRARLVYAIRDGDRWSVEIERYTGVLRLITPNRDEAERLAGALVGQERLEAATFRVRRKAHYFNFVGTISIWVFVYAGLVALPAAPIFGAIMVAGLLPPAIWVALRAVPMLVVVGPWGLVLADAFRVRRVERAELVDGRVVDDDTVRLTFASGESLRLQELSDHPRDREARTSVRPAERFEASLRELLSV